MKIESETPQRVAIVIEQNKSQTWSVVAYLVSADGHRERRRLRVFDTYQEAASSLRKAWQGATV